MLLDIGRTTAVGLLQTNTVGRHTQCLCIVEINLGLWIVALAIQGKQLQQGQQRGLVLASLVEQN